MDADWEALIFAFLRDPPDKAFDVGGHEVRAAGYLAAALERTVDRADVKLRAGFTDKLAAITEHIPTPTAGYGGSPAIGPSADGRLGVLHPLSGSASTLAAYELRPEAVSESIKRLTEGLQTHRDRFLALWRLLPERLAQEVSPALFRAPADVRVPDHTIWNQADAAAGLALASMTRGCALMWFTVGPVQSFIAAARTVRDLWSGSAILSWLVFQSMLPLIRRLGPAAIIFPQLRGNALLDNWLRRNTPLAEKLAGSSFGARRAPSLPHRYLAIVPCDLNGEPAETIAKECRDSAEAAWMELSRRVRTEIDGALGGAMSNWAAQWDAQCSSFFDVKTTVLPLNEAGDPVLAAAVGANSFAAAWPNATRIRRLADAIPQTDRSSRAQDGAGRWQAMVETGARLLAAARSIRHVPATATPANDLGPSAPKCGLFGSYEQVGPSEFQAVGRFWEAMEKVRLRGIRVRTGEKLCAIALTKRFGAPALQREEFGIEDGDLRFDDTATVAAAEWLEQAGIDPNEIRRREGRWSGQWLHWPRSDFSADDPCPPDVFAAIRDGRQSVAARPPAYFAVLSLDADNMGGWLRGELAPAVREVLHPKLTAYFESLGAGARDGLDAQRPVGPALHAAISAALTNYASQIVPVVVARHRGVLIYAGGDDVLALLPVRSAIACARELRLSFSGDPAANGGADPGYYRQGGLDLLTMGSRATVSAGVAVAHFREDLRTALATAREALATAKFAGKDALQVAVMRRSGERSSTLCPWPIADDMIEWTQAFLDGASDRWAYRLRALAPTLGGVDMPQEAVASEIRRQLGRSDENTRRSLGNGGTGDKAIDKAFLRYAASCAKRPGTESGSAFEDFVILCQAASFFARGRDA